MFFKKIGNDPKVGTATCGGWGRPVAAPEPRGVTYRPTQASRASAGCPGTPTRAPAPSRRPGGPRGPPSRDWAILLHTGGPRDSQGSKIRKNHENHRKIKIFKISQICCPLDSWHPAALCAVQNSCKRAPEASRRHRGSPSRTGVRLHTGLSAKIMKIIEKSENHENL